MENLPIWQIILKKEKEDIFNYKIYKTKGSKFNINGDYYTTVFHNDILVTYVVDFGLENKHGERYKYSTEHIFKSHRVESEIIFYNNGKLLDSEIYKVLAFNNHYDISVSMYNKDGLKHSSSFPCEFKYKKNQVTGLCTMQDKVWYLNDKRYTDENLWVQKKRSLKIDLLKSKIKDQPISFD